MEAAADAALPGAGGGTPGPAFVDLHVHADLPWIGPAWRRLAQGFRLDALDGPPGPANPSVAPAALASPAAVTRILGVAFYRTYVLGRDGARQTLFASLERFRRTLLPASGVRILEKRSDLDPGRRAPESFLLCVESARYLRDPADIRRLWDAGVRSLQPIHFLDTPWGGSSREGLIPSGRRGLTPLGRAMLGGMAEAGMLLDLAHMNARTARECLEAYAGPVFCSHTGYSGVRRSARNLDAALAKAVFRRGGIVGVTCWRRLLAADPGRDAWTRAFCATAHALAGLAPEGRSLVAVGSDRGAPIQAPAWFFSPRHLEEIAAQLGRLGWSEWEARGFLGGNAVSFLARSLPRG